MTGSKNSQPTQVPCGLECPSSNSIHIIVSNGSGVESSGTGICNRVCGGEASKPVADPVGVTGPDEDLDAGLNDG